MIDYLIYYIQKIYQFMIKLLTFKILKYEEKNIDSDTIINIKIQRFTNLIFIESQFKF
jgi:hypothetical protein